MPISAYSLKKACAILAIAGLASLATPATAQIPVTDGALIGVQNLFKEMSEQMTKEFLGKEVIQQYLGDNVIKSYLGDNIITQQLGEQTIKKYLGEDAIKGYLGNDILGKMATNSASIQTMINKMDNNEGQYSGRKFSEIKISTEKVLNKTKDLDTDKKTYYGSDTTPNCPTQGNKVLIENCEKARNILAAQLKEIDNIAKALESRNNALQDMMKESNYSTQSELQQKQYAMLTFQTIIANDNMRLQAAMAAYQNMRNVYQEKYNEALQNRISGKSDFFQSLAKGVAAEAGIQAGKAAADSTLKGNIFKK